MVALGWMGLSSPALGEDPFKDMGTSSMWSTLERSKLKLKNKRGEDGKVGPWNENVLSLMGMTRKPPTLKFFEEKKYLNL